MFNPRAFKDRYRSIFVVKMAGTNPNGRYGILTTGTVPAVSIMNVLLFLSGIALLLYPKINAIWTDYLLNRDADAFLSFVHTDAYIQGEDTTQVIITKPGVQEPEETLPAQYPVLWLQMKAYNEDIFLSGQEGLSGEESYVEPSFILADYGLESEVFAVLSIPKLDLKMPIYLGATWQHMADGAAQMTETSLPIGGINTNCVLAGHRGWNGAAYFLHIPNLEKGDTVIITNLWETLTYEVVETKIINPYDVEAIHIQPNRDLITLLTCHPPATGGRQRYLVYCERILELEVP